MKCKNVTDQQQCRVAIWKIPYFDVYFIIFLVNDDFWSCFRCLWRTISAWTSQEENVTASKEM